MPGKQSSPLIWLGKYLSLGVSLPASVFAGYLVGSFAAKHFHIEVLTPVGIFLGMAAGITQIFRELSRDK